MIYIFEDGRTLYDKQFLTPEDNGLYISVEALPEIPPIPGKVGYCVADLETQTVIIKYTDAPELEPPKPSVEPYQPTNSEIAQQISEMYARLIISGVIG